MGKSYSYEILVDELHPPIGGIYKYFAKVAHLYEVPSSGVPGGETPVRHGIGEVHGRTREEAMSKMTDRVREWIDAHAGSQQKT